jgi:hypothetical protein
MKKRVVAIGMSAILALLLCLFAPAIAFGQNFRPKFYAYYKGTLAGTSEVYTIVNTGNAQSRKKLTIRNFLIQTTSQTATVRFEMNGASPGGVTVPVNANPGVTARQPGRAFSSTSRKSQPFRAFFRFPGMDSSFRAAGFLRTSPCG